MSEPQLKIVSFLHQTARDAGDGWSSSQHEAVVGKDILELLSSSMYVDPMSVYREYVQNAADSIDEARSQGLLEKNAGSVSIRIDANTRTIRLRDDGTSIPWADFAIRLSNLGASLKRGTPARGFRGVGRLSGLGYCQELIFRGRTDGEDLVSELRWDGRALKTMLRNSGHDKNLKTLVNEIISVRRVSGKDQPKRFFEVEMRGVIRHRDDRLLTRQSVADYLSQVAPVPFSPDFKYGGEISSALGQFVRLGNLAVTIDDSEVPLYRPHRDVLKVDGEVEAKFSEMQVVEIHGIDGGTSAFGWILHHEYAGALSNRTLVKGIRLRSGNVQVGDNNLVEALFAEPRFNSWAVGEIHIVDPKVLPNGRRDNFEHSVHLDNVINQIGPSAREITRRCRQNSIARKLEREFEIHRDAALERAKTVSRGGITKAARQLHADAAFKSIKAMRKVLEGRNLDEEVKSSLAHKADSIEGRVKTLIGEKAEARDPLAMFSGVQRAAYEKVISLIYECSVNKIVAGLLVDKLLVKLTVETKAKNSPSKRSAKAVFKRSPSKKKSR